MALFGIPLAIIKLIRIIVAPCICEVLKINKPSMHNSKLWYTGLIRLLSMSMPILDWWFFLLGHNCWFITIGIWKFCITNHHLSWIFRHLYRGILTKIYFAYYSMLIWWQYFMGNGIFILYYWLLYPCVMVTMFFLWETEEKSLI